MRNYFPTKVLRSIVLFSVSLALLVVGYAPSSFAAKGAKASDSILATASTGGTYYPVGVAISTLVKLKLQPKHKIGMSAISSAGSAENIKLLRENEAQYGILQGLYGFWAWTGTGPLKGEGPQKELRAITMLWQNVEQFIVLSKYAKTGTIADFVALKGKGMKVALGKKNSGTIGSNRALLSKLNVDLDKDYKLFYAGYGPSADALQNGQVVGINTPSGVPTGAITKAFASMGNKITLLGLTPEQAKKADGGLELWTPFTIKAGDYPSLKKDVTTIAQPNILVVRSDATEESVYMITKTIYENLPFLSGIHKATKAMSIDKAIVGIPMPLHPGAIRYYKEVGIKVPAKLIPKK
ncbi:MAG: TAXI family TRAP transporter solute-binding subunit [Nitrospinota bacterium]